MTSVRRLMTASSASCSRFGRRTTIASYGRTRLHLLPMDFGRKQRPRPRIQNVRSRDTAPVLYTALGAAAIDAAPAPALRRRAGFFIINAVNHGLHLLLKLAPGQHDDAAAAEALDAEVHARSQHLPAVVAARVRLAHLHDVAQIKLGRQGQPPP